MWANYARAVYAENDDDQGSKDVEDDNDNSDVGYYHDYK